MDLKALLLSTFLIIGLNNKCQSQIAETDLTSPDQFVYWFQIRANIVPEITTKRPIYAARLTGEKPMHGTIKEYKKQLWTQLKIGRHLLIGPFLDYYQALCAMQMYKLQNQKGQKFKIDTSRLKGVDIKDEYFWYMLKFDKKNRKGAFFLERMPARVASGGIKDFKSTLSEGLTWQTLAIGPFPSLEEAEISKNLNRLEE